jgi:hypothetical protein
VTAKKAVFRKEFYEWVLRREFPEWLWSQFLGSSSTREFVRSSPTSQLLSNSLKKSLERWIRGVRSRREFRSVKM